MKTPCLILALVASVTTALAVDPSPDGGYPNENTAEGQDALFSLPSDSTGQNTALGYQAMYNNTYGAQSVAVGDGALFSNTTGDGGTAIGYLALHSNTTGNSNTAIGEATLTANTVGFSNVAIGSVALGNNATGNFNIAVGDSALTFSTTGSYNTALGAKAIAFNSTGHDKAAVGYGALNMNTTGTDNVSVGSSALGFLTTGTGNTAIGRSAGQNVITGSNNIFISSQGAPKDEGVIRIGTSGTQSKTFVAGISGVTVASGVAVMINSKGQLGTVTSSARYKEEIKPMAKASEAILSLKPVTFRYKKELDPENISQFGLVAEQVAKVDPDLVAKDDQGKPYTVRYEAVNAMLLNEFLKAHQKIEDQADKIQRLESRLEEVTARLDAKGL